jgi:hypothetical protein
MGFAIATTFGLAAWLVLWSLDVKAIDAFFIPLIIVLVASMARMLSPYLPGNRR